ncbi:hypothetical protein AYI68_g8242 [Smittium mucronatum]|uniref:Retrotransposon gag domain-containing protein n=1 Tax=Smittium mucronatum TaxID=133383 RepID=A0A1R0GLG0_9FUNG|nr:hypothetical protein AYI68_g8242 [Smittium mucronatum]
MNEEKFNQLTTELQAPREKKSRLKITTQSSAQFSSHAPEAKIALSERYDGDIGPKTVSMYTSEFRRLMMDLEWNESAIVSQFSEGLKEIVLDTLALLQTPSDLEEYINAAIKFDTKLTRRKEEKFRKRRGIQPPLPTINQSPELMKIDSVNRTASQPEQDRIMYLEFVSTASLKKIKFRIVQKNLKSQNKEISRFGI